MNIAEEAVRRLSGTTLLLSSTSELPPSMSSTSFASDVASPAVSMEHSMEHFLLSTLYEDQTACPPKCSNSLWQVGSWAPCRPLCDGLHARRTCRRGSMKNWRFRNFWDFISLPQNTGMHGIDVLLCSSVSTCTVFSIIILSFWASLANSSCKHGRSFHATGDVK